MPIVQLPRCETCGTDESVSKCPECGHWTCFDCRNLIAPDKCEHKLKVLLPSNPNWERK